ncbi:MULTISPECIES: hypothetical protein [Muribaculaceae]|uniref:Uncharacterized protein n=2 Tax=Muribaculaceae TaxID=2005473 RepID=A0A4Z0V114_9BACT|nr:MULTISPECIES: hypothetical protein [Muribaculaceae]QCD37152.1 hypothetical protein E7746_14520 [Muribaculum gordoncarteri]TGG35076.1 hypothetical protein EZ315_15430 [Duncaniella freteri]
MAGNLSIDLGKVAISPKGAYSSATTYERLDLVSYNNGAYLSIKDGNTNHAVTDGAWWFCVVSAAEALAAAANANAAKEQALQMANVANTAAGNANTQAAAASAAAAAATTAASEAQTAKEETISATELCQALIDAASQVTSLGLLPSGMTVEYPEELTLGNLAEIFIRAKLQPEYSLPNIMYLSDNNAVSVAPDGRISINHEGVSVIHVIPTGNTQLYKTISIRVKCAGISLVNNRNTAMILSSGNFLLN